MAEIAVNTFDLYNTTKYWTGYSFPGYTTEQQVASAYYFIQFSSNPIGSQIDFFNELAGRRDQNPTFQINAVSSVTITIDTLPYLWGKYWWDKAIYYSNTTIYSALSTSSFSYYQPFSESAGTLYYISRVNNLQNQNTKVYNTVIDSLLIPEVSVAINAFYTIANDLFLTNKNLLGPGTGTDTNPGTGPNGTLIQADTDLTRRITSNSPLTAIINQTYSKLYRFLPYNTSVIGNTLVPYYWGLSSNCEDTTIVVDFTNNNIAPVKQLVTGDLVAK